MINFDWLVGKHIHHGLHGSGQVVGYWLRQTDSRHTTHARIVYADQKTGQMVETDIGDVQLAQAPAPARAIKVGNVDLGGDQWHDERPGQGYPQG